jgi:hypothetical protein
VSTTWQTVHVRVNDAATGQPTPVRIRITGPGGEYFAPLGRLTRFATNTGVDVGGNVLLGDKAHAYMDGTCEFRLPAGALEVEIHKGPEYKPLCTALTLTPGKLALRFELERWINLREQQWYSGDTRSHFLTPHAALLEAAAEDVAVVNLLIWECLIWGEMGIQYPAISNILAFTGQRPALEMPGHIVVVNTMNLHNRLGRLLLLNCHRVVYPLTCGGPDRVDNWSLADWCDQCHRKGGLVIGDAFFGHYPGHPLGEILADLILEKIDALQMEEMENPEVDAQLGQCSPLQEWYELLDCGFQIPLVGGSAKDNNLGVLGSPRTYARLAPGQEFNYHNWIEAVRAGRVFVSTGPLLFFSVNGEDPGTVINLDSTAPPVRVRTEVRCLVPLLRLEIVANNAVVGSIEPTGSPASAMLETEVTLPSGGWLLARCWGEYDDALESWVAAITSPVYVQVQGRSPQPDQATVSKFVGYLDSMQNWARQEARCENDRQREHLAGIFQSAREVLLRRCD